MDFKLDDHGNQFRLTFLRNFYSQFSEACFSNFQNFFQKILSEANFYNHGNNVFKNLASSKEGTND